jgi:hypothetical protein
VNQGRREELEKRRKEENPRESKIIERKKNRRAETHMKRSINEQTEKSKKRDEISNRSQEGQQFNI